MDFRMFFSQLRMGLKLYVRRPAAILWMTAFPILMLLALGGVFGGHADTGVKLVWSQVAPASAVDTLMETALVERGLTVEILAPDDAEARWQLGKMPALLEGRDGRYSLRLNSYLGAQGMQAEALVQQAFLMAQARAQGAAELARIPITMSSPGGHHGGPYAAYLLPGLMGLNLLMMGVFSTGIVDVTLRENGSYKRLATTPMPRHIYLGASLCVRLIVVIVSATLLMLTGAVVFGVQNQGSYADIFALLMLGAACFISLGIPDGQLRPQCGVLQRHRELGVFAADAAVGRLFLTRFGADVVTAWRDFLPLAPLLKALRATFNDGASLASQGTGLVTVACWTLLLFVLASRRFKWV